MSVSVAGSDKPELLPLPRPVVLAIRRSALMTVLAAVGYTLIIHYVYIFYLSRGFEGIGYEYHPRSNLYTLFSVLLTAAPAILFRDKLSAGGFLASVIYVLAYVSIQVVIFYSVNGANSPLLPLQIALLVSMCAIFVASWEHNEEPAQVKNALPGGRWLIAGMAAMTLSVIVAYRGHFQLVSFADVYALRFENEALGGGLVGYVVMWLMYCFLPLGMARGLVYRDWPNLLISLAGALLIYMATGAKVSALAPLIAAAVYLLLLGRGSFLRNLMLAASAGLICVLVVVPDEGVSGFIKALLFQRAVGTPGWTVSVYYKYFADHGYTYYSHIGLVNMLTDSYSYGPYSLGQLLGIEVAGNTLANFNASFWATDGVAALGVVGAYIVTIPVAAYTYLLNAAAKGVRTEVMAIWLTGFALGMLNLPLATTMFSGGGALILLIAALSRVRAPRALAPERPEPDLSSDAGIATRG